MITRQIFLISFLTIFCGFNTTVVLADSVLPERSEIEFRVLEAVKETTKNNPPKRQNNYDTKSFLKNKQRNKAQAFCIEWDNFIPKVLSGDKKLEIISIGNSWKWSTPKKAKAGAIKFCKKRMSGSSFNNKDPIVSDCKCEVLHLNNEFFLPASAKQVISTYIENVEAKRAAELTSKKKEEETKLAAELASKKKEAETKLAAELMSKKKEAEAKLAAELASKKKEAEAKLAAELESKKKEKAKLAAELASKKKEEEAKLAAELASKKKEEETKARQLKLKINSAREKSSTFYDDINEFVKSGGDLDLLKLSDLFDLKPDPKNIWTVKDLTNFKNLENFVRSNNEFVVFEKDKSVQRKIQFEETKTDLILSLNNNLDKLNSLFRENFSVAEFAKPIKNNIKKIESLLDNKDTEFALEIVVNTLNESTETIEIITGKISRVKILDKNLSLYKTDLDTFLRSNFGTDQGKKASRFLKKIETVKTVLDKENLNVEITTFLRKNNVIAEKPKSEEIPAVTIAQSTKSDSQTNSGDNLFNTEEIQELIEDGKGYQLAPNSQKFLNNLIKETMKKYNKDDNSLKKKRYWIKASNDLCSSSEFRIDAEKVDWVGYVDSITPTDDGSVHLDLKINDLGNEVGVVNYNGPLIDVIIELKSGTLFKTGDFVKFSGFFKKGKISENECLSGAGFDALNSNPELDGSDFAFTLTNISIY